MTRFAPSPTGLLHLGHAFSAMTAYVRGRQRDGVMLLRIEDIDRARSKPEWESRIHDDLHWLGLSWPEPVMRQSTRRSAYRAALERLVGMGICYPCRCTRRDIRAALSAPQEGASTQGFDGTIYPGTCRKRKMADAGTNDTIRINISAALDCLSERGSSRFATECLNGGKQFTRKRPESETGAAIVEFSETGPLHSGTHVLTRNEAESRIGDIVLARRDIGTSYHLSVVVDDAEQGITEVVRGEDLFAATYIHALLQDLLGLPRPAYFHHALIRDDFGRRLAKRDDSRAISRYREDGLSPRDVRRILGIIEERWSEPGPSRVEPLHH